MFDPQPLISLPTAARQEAVAALAALIAEVMGGAYRAYIITASWMISGELLKYRKGFCIPKRKGTSPGGSSRFALPTPNRIYEPGRSLGPMIEALLGSRPPQVVRARRHRGNQEAGKRAPLISSPVLEAVKRNDAPFDIERAINVETAERPPVTPEQSELGPWRSQLPLCFLFPSQDARAHRTARRHLQSSLP